MELKEHISILMDLNEKRIDTIFENLNTKINSQTQLIQSTLAASEKAITKAEKATEKRFESVNEFRKALNDSQRTYMPRIETELLINQLSAKVDVNTNTLLKRSAEGAGLHKGWTVLVGAIGVIGIVTTIVLHFFVKK